MRRLILSGLVTAVASAALASSAAASYDPHFSVLASGTGGHNTSKGFTFADELVATFDHSLRVGRDRGECTAIHDNKLNCDGTIRLNGKVGGRGQINVEGHIGRHDARLNVTGGTGNFNGVAGKMTLHGNNRYEFDLVK